VITDSATKYTYSCSQVVYNSIIVITYMYYCYYVHDLWHVMANTGGKCI